MKCYVSRKRCMSHLDPSGCRVLAARMSARLQDWFTWCVENKQPVLFLTLTYDPKDYGDPYDGRVFKRVYKASRDGKHVSRFMARLAEYLGADLKGKWICKTEFQASGLLHFHILLRGFHRIDHSDLTKIWGHGHVLIKKANRRSGPYMAKYQSKAGGYPDFMYTLPRRGVKIWGTSPGFWDCVNKSQGDSEADSLGAVRSLCKAAGTRSGYDPDETIGAALERVHGIVVVRDEYGETREYATDYGAFLSKITGSGYKPLGARWGWLAFDNADWSSIEALALYASSEARTAIGEADFQRRCSDYMDETEFEAELVGGAASGREAATAEPLYLIKYQDRDLHPEQETISTPNGDFISPIPVEDWPDEYAPF